MQKTLATLSLAVGIGLVCCQNAGAVPASAIAVHEAAAAASPLQRAQYNEYRARRGIVKCYREFVVGPYRCHHFRWSDAESLI
jgi:hypothetical protein